MTEFASSRLTAGQLNAIVKKLGGHEGALRFLRGELSVSDPTRAWREEGGVIYFSVTSDGTTGENWIKRLEGDGFQVAPHAKWALRSLDFKPTNHVTIEVAVLRGRLFENNDQIIKNVCMEADKRGLSKPNLELACLIREKFTDKELEAMGLLYITAMHEPIKGSDGESCLLRVARSVDDSWLDTYNAEFGSGWGRNGGLAFVASQVSSQD